MKCALCSKNGPKEECNCKLISYCNMKCRYTDWERHKEEHEKEMNKIRQEQEFVYLSQVIKDLSFVENNTYKLFNSMKSSPGLLTLVYIYYKAKNNNVESLLMLDDFVKSLIMQIVTIKEKISKEEQVKEEIGKEEQVKEKKSKEEQVKEEIGKEEKTIEEEETNQVIEQNEIVEQENEIIEQEDEIVEKEDEIVK